jgi:mono/diheme cytochrome c family protein
MRNTILAASLALALTSAAALAHEHHAMEGHWMAPEKAAKRHNPVAATPESLQRGAALFQQHCASCHGAQGAGDGPAAAALEPKPANLQTMAGHHSDGDLAWKIAHGRGAMPAWRTVLKPNQIWDLVNHIRHLGG